MKRMGEIIQHGDRWIITDEGRALQLIDDLRVAIDHALAGDLLDDPAARLDWLRAWRLADQKREAPCPAP
jgi:hypothetical protein